MATTRHQAAGDERHLVDDQLRAVLDAMPTLVWLAAADGAAVHISQRWLEYTGLSVEQAGGWGWTIPVHHDDINRLTTHWQHFAPLGRKVRSKSACGARTVDIVGFSSPRRRFMMTRAN